MPNTTTPAKGLTQPQVGGDGNTWGGLINTDLSLIDSALGGTAAISISGNTTLTTLQTQNTGYEFTGTLTANVTITWPPGFNGVAAIHNGTTDGFSISCGISGGGFTTIFAGERVAVWSDGTNFHRLAQIGGNLPRSATQTSAYTVQASDQWKTLSFAGNNCYTVTIPAASGFVGNFEVRLYNADAGRAKWLSINGYSSFFLWPKQSVVVQNVGGAWQLFPVQQRWAPPLSTNITFFVDPSGSDAGGRNDGLTQASAFATLTNAFNTIHLQTDTTAEPTIQLTPGATYDFPSSQMLVGDASQGYGRLVSITGDATLVNPPKVSCASGPAITFRDGAWAQLVGIHFGPGGNGVNIQQKALCDLNDCIWDTMSSGVHIGITDGGECNLGGTHKIVGGALIHWNVEQAAKLIVAATIDGASTASNFSDYFLQAYQMARVDFSDATFINASAITGVRYNIGELSLVITGGLTLPGNSAGSVDATSVLSST